MTWLIRIAAAALVVGAAVLVWLLPPAKTAVEIPSGVSSRDAGMLERGAYVFRIAGCVTCHTAKGGVPFAGGRALETPFGTFHVPNITSDRETGIGAWSDAEIKRSLTDGERPDGPRLAFVMPYPLYRAMTPRNLNALVAWLCPLPPLE
jgi:mono/diheme cytochrome c family protein